MNLFFCVRFRGAPSLEQRGKPGCASKQQIRPGKRCTGLESYSWNKRVRVSAWFPLFIHIDAYAS
jgi:hypothetical protein